MSLVSPVWNLVKCVSFRIQLRCSSAANQNPPIWIFWASYDTMVTYMRQDISETVRAGVSELAIPSLIARFMGPGPRWAPCGPCEPCYLGWYGWFIWEFPEQGIEIFLEQVDCTSSHAHDRPWDGIEEPGASYSYAWVSDNFDFSRCSWRDNWHVAKSAMTNMPCWYDELTSWQRCFIANPSSIFQIYIYAYITFSSTL